MFKPMVGRLCSLEPLRDSGMGTVEHKRAGLQCSGLLTPTSTGTAPPLFALSTELLSQLFLKELFWSVKKKNEVHCNGQRRNPDRV